MSNGVNLLLFLQTREIVIIIIIFYQKDIPSKNVDQSNA